MSYNINLTMFGGTISKDAEITFAATTGTMIASFNLVTDHPYKKGEAMTLKCSLFGKKAESIVDYLKKGTRATVKGSIVIDRVDQKVFVSLSGDDIYLMGGGNKNEHSGAKQSGTSKDSYRAQKSGETSGGKEVIRATIF